MSVVFITFSNKCINLCADKRATNMKTGKFQDNARKIERWYSDLAIGYAGNQTVANLIIPFMRNYVREENISHNVEEISNWFCQAFYAVKDEYPDMPKGLVTRFVIAGKLANGNLGVGDILTNDNDPDLEIYEGQETPSTLILSPEDMTELECNLLLKKATMDTKAKDKNHKDLIETIHRKAVKYVSEKSIYVGSTSDYIYMAYDEMV